MLPQRFRGFVSHLVQGCLWFPRRSYYFEGSRHRTVLYSATDYVKWALVQGRFRIVFLQHPVKQLDQFGRVQLSFPGIYWIWYTKLALFIRSNPFVIWIKVLEQTDLQTDCLDALTTLRLWLTAQLDQHTENLRDAHVSGLKEGPHAPSCQHHPLETCYYCLTLNFDFW